MNMPQLSGLSTDEALRRLAAEGANILPAGQYRLDSLLFSTLRDPMFLLLLGASILYLALGEPHEGAVLLCMVAITIGLTLIQEGKTERALQALRMLSSPRALVLRGIRLGRRVFANMRNAMSYVLSMHVPIAGMALLSSHGPHRERLRRPHLAARPARQRRC
jgi:magnesium-transporting ATPase (P-type)